MSNIMERLAALRANATGAPATTTSSPLATSKELAGAKALVQAAAAKVEAAPVPVAGVDAAEVMRIIADIKPLEASSEMKGIEGFSWQSFESAMLEINNLTGQGFPEISGALSVINKDLRKFPELAHLLNDSQIKVIVQRILLQKNLWIAPQKAVKAKKVKEPSSKDLADLKGEIDADDI